MLATRRNISRVRIDVYKTTGLVSQAQEGETGIYGIIARADDELTCEWCGEHIGRVYRMGQFMPDLPKHVNCWHFWDLEYVGEKKR